MSAVKIKGVGGKQGLVFVVNLNEDIDVIKKELKNLLQDTKQYFSKNALNLNFIETQSDDEYDKKREVQKTIIDEGFLISCNVEVLEKVVVQEKMKTMIVRNSLRAGARFTFDGNLIVFGDVKDGARVEVTGSFICIGTIYGIVCAGHSNDGKMITDEICVYAQRINSPRIKIKNEKILNIKETNWLHIVE